MPIAVDIDVMLARRIHGRDREPHESSRNDRADNDVHVPEGGVGENGSASHHRYQSPYTDQGDLGRPDAQDRDYAQRGQRERPVLRVAPADQRPHHQCLYEHAAGEHYHEHGAQRAHCQLSHDPSLDRAAMGIYRISID